MTIQSKPTTQEYRDNYDRVFGKNVDVTFWCEEAAEITPEMIEKLKLPDKDRRRLLEGEWKNA